MYLERLYLKNFKNYDELTLELEEGINCIIGPNGIGKTNLIDAVYMLSMTKSAFSFTENQNVKHGTSDFALSGRFKTENDLSTVICQYDKSKKKISLNGKEYSRFSEHFGKFPCVLIAPNDTDLLREGSEIRRRYFDSVISQFDKEYLQSLIDYQRALLQRNQLLKNFAEQRQIPNKEWVAPYNHMLLKEGQKIHSKRKLFIEEFLFNFKEAYVSLAGEENADINYKSDFGSNTIFEESWEKDIALQRTTKGIHKDDFDFRLNTYPLKKFGSQGQQKSFIIALKLGQYLLLKKQLHTSPILLLDDIFDKLDDIRIKKLLDLIKEKKFNQILLSDARPERSKTLIDQISMPCNIIELKK
ncbi:DNA replication/repair protein RecF [Flammeovirga sp. SJP92]|uniref:DNA replication/repair protein RecF n=1 Tax=Flammeovirga sp. SJP92 TaxID=1775430 RepID=UPI000788A4E6|nr:DNA replication and repair protein RecF [Flammeovirga sp. SJP92]KXX68584.1 hypothetical protein AVL50_22760 [Flammeovirga sp. SJP92]